MSSVELITGEGRTVKSSMLVSVPSGVVTEILPVVAVAGTVAVTCVLETGVKLEATLLNFTVVVPVKPLPEMVTELPTAPEAGLKLVIFGRTLNTSVLTVGGLAPQLDTVMRPVVAPTGTTAVICTDESTVKTVVLTVSNRTLDTQAESNPLPEMVTLSPTLPLVGVKLVIFGTTVKVPALVAVPAGLVTVILPVMAVAGTVALIEVEETTTSAPAETPPKVTSVAVSRPVPSMVTSVPVVPLVGVKLVIVGAGTTLTVKVQVVCWPQASWAVQVTVV